MTKYIAIPFCKLAGALERDAVAAVPDPAGLRGCGALKGDCNARGDFGPSRSASLGAGRAPLASRGV